MNYRKRQRQYWQTQAAKLVLMDPEFARRIVATANYFRWRPMTGLRMLGIPDAYDNRHRLIKALKAGMAPYVTQQEQKGTPAATDAGTMDGASRFAATLGARTL